MNPTNFAHAGLAFACQILTALIALAFGADLFEAFVMGGGSFGRRILLGARG